MSDLGIYKITFDATAQDYIALTVNAEALLINNIEFPFDGQKFKMGITTDGYNSISSVSADVQVEYNPISGEYYYNSSTTGRITLDLLETNGITENTENFRYYSVCLLLLGDFIAPGAEFNIPSIREQDASANTLQRGGRPDQGTFAFVAAGFHLDRASAEGQCRHGYYTIKNTNKGVFSYGYSISCLYDNTACWCTSKWYYGICNTCP